LIVICSDNVTNVNYPFFAFNKQKNSKENDLKKNHISDVKGWCHIQKSLSPTWKHNLK
jgi:hypothetical protein